MRRLALLPTVATLLTLAACSGSTAATPSASAPAASAPAASTAAGGGAAACAAAPAGSTATVSVTIKDFKFAPQPVEAKVGDIVAWSNQDGSTSHSATMDNGACDTKTIAGGSTAMLVFTTAGTYTYHCSIHPGQMKDYSVEVK